MLRAAAGRPNTLEDRAVQTPDVNLLATADAKQFFAHKSNAAPQVKAAEQLTNPERSRFLAKTMPSSAPSIGSGIAAEVGAARRREGSTGDRIYQAV